VRIPREFIDQLLARIDLVDFIRAAGVPLQKKSASNYFARCPFHQEKSPSFSVSQTKQFYHCFGCGVHGNVIDFVMQQDHLTFPEAIETLARLQGMSMPIGSEPSLRKHDHQPDLYDLMLAASDFYYEHMRRSPTAIAYLKQRGVTGAIAKQFVIGFAPSGWQGLIDGLGKTEKLLEAGLVIKKSEGKHYDRFRERIMFPIHDVRGRIVGFGGRVLGQEEPKYLNSPETPIFQKGQILYGLYHALKAHRQLERVLIVEGYMDVVALAQHGIAYAVATMGTAATKEHIERLSRYTSDMIFCFDGDQAGRTAATRALYVMLPLVTDTMQMRFLFLPEGEDPDSLIRKEGKNAFEARIQQSLSLSQFLFQSIATQNQCDLTTVAGRTRFATLALNALKPITAPLLQNMLLEELSKRARIEVPILRQQLRKTAHATPQPLTPTSAPTPTTMPALSPPLKLATTLLLQDPSLIEHYHDTAGGMLAALAAIIHEHPSITTGGLIEHFRDRPEHELLRTLAQWDPLIPDEGRTTAFKQTLQKWEQMTLEATIQSLLAKAAQSGLLDEEKATLAKLISQKNAVL